MRRWLGPQRTLKNIVGFSGAAWTNEYWGSPNSAVSALLATDSYFLDLALFQNTAHHDVVVGVENPRDST
jgi:hypothetical protein